ncbi:MAG: tyrosine--tRNA ligase [Candidatus Paceibacterota bacterium]
MDNKDKINELLTRGVDKIYPSKNNLEQVLLSGKKLRIYQGFDPTGSLLHLGHMVGFRKHRQWQDLGHEVIFLIGDGTGQAGDPTGKKKTREKFFTQEELRANAKDYLNQASKIVRFTGNNPIKIMYNGDWLNKLNLKDILDIAQYFSVQQLIERDMFQDRLKAGEPINLREFLYPLLQGYDSVALDVDLELGGTDQTFNMLVGRTLLKTMKGKEKFVMTMPLLSDSTGVKIGKSENNVIGMTDKPEDLFGKIMALGDDTIIPMFNLLTDVPEKEIKKFDLKKDALKLKKKVAGLIIEQLHSEKDALSAEESFSNTFQKGEIPDAVEEVENKGRPIDVILARGGVKSLSAARILLDAGAIKDMTEDKKITQEDKLQSGHVYKIGKHKFIKII